MWSKENFKIPNIHFQSFEKNNTKKTHLWRWYGEICLFENSNPGEETNDLDFSKSLSSNYCR